jgi:starch synthase (maltosyl-transferring)
VPVWVDRPLALFGAWYEMFPRSASFEPGRHGTLDDVRRRLDYVAEMGFEVLYLPPIHPIGRTERKGRNNSSGAEPDEVGSPWAIGSSDGGHKSVHPDLGTLEDFDRLVAAASEKGIEIALDIAFQCSPDHPYVTEHPEWFRHRPDGSVQYAENPPKKYQDIYPFDFECDNWRALWAELKSIFVFWAERGVLVFRVDNPHTKPFAFWDWVIAEVRREYPDAIFLSEAFTRPKKMQRLAKGGFTQSYTYFTWRKTAEELRAYVEELAKSPLCDLMRPSFWPNTPDILTEQIASGGRDGAMARLVLAATLTPTYGIYGPVYELADFVQRPGAEENLNSEKYEVRWWDRDDRWSLRHFIAGVNRIRRDHPALQQFRRVRFHHCDNTAHLAYSKRSEDGADTVLCVVNTDAMAERWGVVRLDLDSMGLTPDEEFTAHDLLSGIAYAWRGADHAIGLGPGRSHIFRIGRPPGPGGDVGGGDLASLDSP